MTQRALVVGILNCTPDSFYDGGTHGGAAGRIRRGEQMLAEGADWIDIGGESTRPGADRIPDDEQLRRILPVIEGLAPSLDDGRRISVDTTSPGVAARALQAGATVINDVSDLADPDMPAVTADAWGAVVMHMRGTPATMGQLTDYDDLVGQIRNTLVERAALSRAQHSWIDPGIGFAKTAPQSLQLIARTAALVRTGYPVLVGASRKSFIGRVLGLSDPRDRLYGSLAAAAAAWQRGATAFRVHDVAPTRQLLDMLAAVDRADDAGPGGSA